MKDWREILRIRYNKNGPELTPQEKGTLLFQIHVLAQIQATNVGDPNFFRFFALRVQREYFQRNCYDLQIKGNFDTKDWEEKIYGFYFVILQKLHFAFPQLRLYEFFMGFCLIKSNFLMPSMPEN